jgi:hypothetical protein
LRGDGRDLELLVISVEVWSEKMPDRRQ